ncbi:DUF4229 domain-containing protein [Saccharopolyspora sp. NPDC050642]|uniref:DUF4229 domain-containing protein n=1 Tax=Saccharopolyspora sp. NPDC050642 TaxID=3157099 RepID=UPI00340BC6AB
MQEQQKAPTSDQGAQPNLTRDITLYTLARLGLVAAVTALLVLVHVPVLVALAVAVVVAMPLSLLVFGGLRRKVAAGMAERGARRAELRAQLRGERTADVQ